MGETGEAAVDWMSAVGMEISSLVAGSRSRVAGPSGRRFTPDLVSPFFSVTVVRRKLGSMLRLGSRMSSMVRWIVREPMPSREGPRLPPISLTRWQAAQFWAKSVAPRAVSGLAAAKAAVRAKMRASRRAS